MSNLSIDLIVKILEYNFDEDMDWNIIINKKNQILYRFNNSSLFSKILKNSIISKNNYMEKRISEYEKYYNLSISNYKNHDNYNVIFGSLYFNKNVIEAIKILDFLVAYNL